MTDLNWTTTDKGYAAAGATTNYNINRTPGHRFWLCVDGAQVKSGKLTDLKAVAQANENAGGGTDDGPKSGAGRPTGNGKPRTSPKPPTPTATNPDTKAIHTAVINRAHTEAVEATTADAYPPRKPAVTAESSIPDYIPPTEPRPGTPVNLDGGNWAIPGPRQPLTVSTAHWPAAVPSTLPDDDDADDSDIDTPLAPTTPDTGDPVGFNVVGTQTMRTQCSAPRPPLNVHRPFLRPPAPITDQDGRPIRSWLSR